MKGWMDGTPSFLAGSNHYSCCPVTIGQQQWLWRVCVCELYLVASQFFLATALCSVCVFFMCSFLVVRCSCPLFLFLLFFQCIYFYCTTRVCVLTRLLVFSVLVFSLSVSSYNSTAHTHIERKRQTL